MYYETLTILTLYTVPYQRQTRRKSSSSKSTHHLIKCCNRAIVFKILDTT